jgi:hypothetical protein
MQAATYGGPHISSNQTIKIPFGAKEYLFPFFAIVEERLIEACTIWRAIVFLFQRPSGRLHV